MGRPAVFVSMALLLTALGAAGHAQERRVICVVVDDLGFGASDQENGAKLLAILRDEVVKESDLVGFVSTGPLPSRPIYNPPASAASSTRWNGSGPPLQESRPCDPINRGPRPAWRWSPRLTLWEIWRGSRTAISSCFY